MRKRREPRVAETSFQKRQNMLSKSGAVYVHENEAASLFGGKRHRGSGAVEGHKSDASSDDFQIECKQTEKKSLILKLEWLEKINNEAVGKKKKPALHVRFTSETNPVIKDWVMIPASIWEQYVCKFSKVPD